MKSKDNSVCKQCDKLFDCLGRVMSGVQKPEILADGEAQVISLLGAHEEGLVPFMLEEMDRLADAGAKDGARLRQIAKYVRQYAEFQDMLAEHGDFAGAGEKMRRAAAVLATALITNESMARAISMQIWQLSNILPFVREELELGLGKAPYEKAMRELMLRQKHDEFGQVLFEKTKKYGDFTACSEEERRQMACEIAEYMQATQDEDDSISLAHTIVHNIKVLLSPLAEELETMGKKSRDNKPFFAKVLGAVRQGLAIWQLEAKWGKFIEDGRNAADLSPAQREELVGFYLDMMKAVQPPEWAGSAQEALMEFPLRSVKTMTKLTGADDEIRRQLGKLVKLGPGKKYFGEILASYEAEMTKIAEAKAIEERVANFFTSDELSTAGALALVEESPTLAEEVAKYTFTQKMNVLYDRVVDKIAALAEGSEDYQKVLAVCRQNTNRVSAGKKLLQAMFGPEVADGTATLDVFSIGRGNRLTRLF